MSHDSIPTEADLISYYASQYRLDYHNESTPSPRRVMRAWRQGRRLLRLLSPFIEPGSTVVEIGAGIGCTVKAFELAGHAARGYEPGGGFQSYSQDKLHAKVERTSLAQVPTSPTADLALLVHVIEHLRDPLSALEKIRELIGDDGLLYVECPNLSAPFARPGKRFHRAHIFNFSGASLEAFAHRAGLETVRRFGSDRHPNLAFLFRPGEKADAIDASNYAQTMRALERYNALTYHLRPWYLSARAIKVSRYLFEHISAPIVVGRLEKRCMNTNK